MVSFQAGDTFLYPLGHQSLTEHLWIIATPPNADQQFAIVSLTSLRGSKDQTVILLAREHAFVRHDTCVLYAAADITDAATVNSWIASGAARMHQPVSPPVLQLVLEGFLASNFTKRRIVDFIRATRNIRL